MPTLSEELRAQLIDFYSGDILRLQDLTGRNLKHWLTPNQVLTGPT